MWFYMFERSNFYVSFSGRSARMCLAVNNQKLLFRRNIATASCHQFYFKSTVAWLSVLLFKFQMLIIIIKYLSWSFHLTVF